MKRNKKGFTIIELVVVIAVIAILAAVLIPTFSSIIKKANLSSDQVAVTNMNTALAVYAVDKGQLSGRIDIYSALKDSGFATDGLKPVSADHKFFYIAEYNKMVLVNESDNVVYPDDDEIKNYYAANKGSCYDMTTSLPAAYLLTMESDDLAISSKLGTGSDHNLTLHTGVTFGVDSTFADNGEWDKWLVDFEISFNKDVPEALNTVGDVSKGLATDRVGFLLMGNYGSYGWQPIVLSSATKDSPKRVMKDLFFNDNNLKGYDFGCTYSEVKKQVGQFKCGIIAVWDLDGSFNINGGSMSQTEKDFLNGLTVTLKLKMYKTEYKNTQTGENVSTDTNEETGESFVISTYTYTWNV